MATSSSYELVNRIKTHEQDLHSTNPTERPWQPGILKQLPWAGLLALLLGFGCGVAALTVALVSDGKALDYWSVYSYSVQPTVLLAILVTFANILLGYAFASGIAIFWWSGALAGRTLRQIHASQSRGDSLVALLKSRPVFNAVTVASGFTILLLMDQPLFQRGIRVVSRSSQETRNLSVPVSSSPIQHGATGIIPDHTSYDSPQLFHPLFAQVVREYQNRDPIQFALPGCKGRCALDVISTGWEVDCIEWETSYRMMGFSDYQMYYDATFSDGQLSYEGPLRTQPAFSVNITYHASDYRSWPNFFSIDTSVMRKATPGANGTMRWHNCTLTEALIRYPVEVSNDTLRLKAMSPGVNRTTNKVYRSTEVSGQYDHPSTLGGIWRALSYQFAALANVSFVGAWTRISTQDIASNTYLQASNNGRLDSIDYNATWSDPTDDIISMAHELTLRAAVATTRTIVVTLWNDGEWETIPNLLTLGQREVEWPNLTLVNRTLSQDAEVTMNFDETVYKVQPQWLAGAFVVIATACLSIIPTYWGWWRLGRPVSMSPLEIAKAFDAPLMHHADPNGTADDHLRALGNIRVRYGYHATIAEPVENDTTGRPNSQPDTLSTHAVDQSSGDEVGLESHSPANGSAMNTPVVRPARPDDNIELQILYPEASPPFETLLGNGTIGSRTSPSDHSESALEPQTYSSLEPEPALSRIYTRIQMRLRFVEE